MPTSEWRKMLAQRNSGPQMQIGPGRATYFDCVVLGAGIAGLLVARRLLQLGCSVALIEKSERIFAGASSRNEGWLHAGTYHAQSIADASRAEAVARRCLYGWEQLQQDFPNCVMREPSPAIAIVRAADLDHALSRWKAAGVVYAPLSPAMNEQLAMSARLGDDESAYAVGDRSIHTRMLAARLGAEVTNGGGQIHLGTSATRVDERVLTVEGESSFRIHFSCLVIATGYNTSITCAELGLPSPNLRLWQSHLGILPRLAPMSVFATAAGEAAMANHGSYSVVGLNEDAKVVPEWTDTPTVEGESQVRKAISRRFLSPDLGRLRFVSCTKTDVLSTHDETRSLDVKIDWLTDCIATVLPGKMTEAPYAADELSNQLFDRLDFSWVTARPFDAKDFAAAEPDE